jgi:RimJ/RimL family protein N-acetyltransferase
MTRPGFCTSRTVVRPFRVDDTPYAHAVFADAEVMRFAAGDPDAEFEATRTRLERYIAHQTEHGFSKWAVWGRDSGAYLGDAGLLVLSETGEVELGYRLGRSHWGCGLATEIARAWLEHAIGPLGLERVIAFADARNLASIRVMGKIGMTFDRHDHLAGMDCVVYEARAR